MIRKPVSSSRMRSVGWEDGIMEVEFKNGSIYHYYNVSESDYLTFINSPSLGSALNKFTNYERII